MGKTLKKILSTMLAFVLLLSSTSVLAGSSGASGLYKYNLYEGTNGSGNTSKWIEISGYTQHISGELVIPSLINGVPVKKIAENAFADCGGITSVTIPSGIYEIGAGAFYGCYNITQVTFQDGDKEAFLGIKDKAFSGCSYLETITLPVKAGYSIGAMAFQSCSSLTNIYYRGTKAQYDASSISVAEYNEHFTSAEVYYVDSVREIHLNKGTLSVIKNNSETLFATIIPSNATNKNIVWNSSNPGVATVTDGTVTAKTVGTAIITATTQDKNKVATCVVTVTENIEEDILGEGDGTALNPYIIDSEEKLQIVSDIPNAHYVLVNDIVLTEKFTPLCSLNSEFSGVFDGNGYTISNLEITDYYEYSGLFGKNSGTIKNLNLSYSPDGANYTFSDSTNFGGIVGFNEGSIINCNVDFNGNIVSSSNPDYTTTIGGIAGRNYNRGTITNCNVDASIVVEVTTASSDIQQLYLGGIAGINNNIVDNCDVDLNILNSVVINEYNYAVSYIGGISGSDSGTVENSNAVYDITVGEASASYVGGIIGSGDSCEIENVSADGKIVSSAKVVNIGGILGTESTSSASSITKANAKLTAEVTEIFGTSRLGGISGYMNSLSEIRESCAQVDFTATKSDEYVAQPELHCGGLVGLAGGTISDSYAKGSLASDLNTTNVYSGGLVGKSESSLEINNSYATMRGVKYGLTYPDGTVTNSFYDKGVSGCSDTGYGSPTASVSMKMKSIYTNVAWDFDNVWNISSTINDGYPHLKVFATTTTIGVKGVSLDKSDLSLNIGDRETLTATVSPQDATNKNLVWSSSDTNVATVSDGVVTAVSTGNATITVKTEDGSYTANCTVVVSAPAQGKVSTPKANVSPGNVKEGTTITLFTETTGAEIYYTTDGSEPTTLSSKYTQAIVINSNTTIKAIAVKESMENSSVATFTYTLIDDNKATISISNNKGKAGDTVVLTLDVTNNPGIGGMLLSLSYDEGLTLTNIAVGDALSTLTFTPPAIVSKNPCNLLWDGITADNTNGTVLTLTFEISETASEGDYDVSVSYRAGDIYDGDTEDIDVQIVNGVVTVYKYKLGDVNEDDTINAKDITMLRKFISGDYGVTINEDAADVNKDGVLNAKDITILRKYISGDYGIVLD